MSGNFLVKKEKKERKSDGHPPRILRKCEDRAESLGDQSYQCDMPQEEIQKKINNRFLHIFGA